MARSYGKTYLSIWGDGDFRALHPDAQRMYLFLTSQQDLSCVGTIPLRISRWANCAADQLTAEQWQQTVRMTAELMHAAHAKEDRQ